MQEALRPEGSGDAPTPSLLTGLPELSATDWRRVLAAGASLDLRPGMPYFRSSFGAAALLVVEQGFVVVRAALPDVARTVITCEAGAGRLVLPPAPEQVLFSLGDARLRVISPESVEQLLTIPGVAPQLVEQLAFTLEQKQEAIAMFALTRHVERVRRKLLQLARSHGRVARNGIRIDFPLSHALLAEMIGSSRETVTRALHELHDAGFVERNGSTYTLRPHADARHAAVRP